VNKALSSQENKHDAIFYDRFMVILGILLGVAVLLFIIARSLGVNAINENNQTDPAFQLAIGERIEPVGRVAVAGQDFIDEADKVIDVELVQAVLTGPQVYNAICGSCHGSGLAGAPMTGDNTAWSARIDKGMDILNKNAINGIQGNAGFMPPKGGRIDLSDDEIMAAVKFMVDQL
jgi:cytochrome c5